MNQVDFEQKSGNFNITNCELHPENKVSVVFLDDSIKQQIGCLDCVLNNEIQVNKLVSIDSILNGKSLVKNWPPFQDKNLNKLNEFIYKFGSFGESNEAQLVVNYFSELKKDINDFISKIEKKIIAQINNLEREKLNLIQKTQDMSRLEQFKEIIINNKDDFKALNSSVKNFLDAYLANLKENEDTLIKESNSFFDKIKQKSDYFEQQKTIISNIIFNEKFYDISQLLSNISSQINFLVQNEIQYPIKVVTKIKDGQFEVNQFQSYTHIQANDRFLCYVDKVLDHEKKYEITIKNILQGDESKIVFGLSVSHNTSFIIYSFIKQQNYQYNGIKSFKEIKIQIWLQKQVFRIQIDGKFFSGAENWLDYKPFENYFFSILSFDRSDIYLQDFKEVNNFQVW
ncbi:hypothetical protein ABPG74_000506 [Tetrahymena malaccensis]